MSHLKELQNTISDLSEQSKYLKSLTEVYERVAQTEENYKQNLASFENLYQLLGSYEQLLERKISAIANQNSQSLTVLQTTNERVEQAGQQILKTKEELGEQSNNITQSLAQVKEQNHSFYEQTQDLIAEKTEFLQSQHEKFYLETTERIQNRLQAITEKNEEFYVLTTQNIKLFSDKLREQTMSFYENSREGIKEELAAFKSFTEERDGSLEEQLLQKIEVLREETQSIHLRADTLFEQLEKRHHQARMILDTLSEFQMQFDSIKTNYEEQEKELHQQAIQLKETNEKSLAEQKQSFESQNMYQKKALKYIFDNQKSSFDQLSEKINTVSEVQQETFEKQKNQLLNTTQNSLTQLNDSQSKLYQDLLQKVEQQEQKINKQTNFQLITLVGMGIIIGLLVFLLAQ